MVTSRLPNDGLYHELTDKIDIVRIGDCNAPGTIATAVYSGHAYAREMDQTKHRDVPFLREPASAPAGSVSQPAD
jgi:dimethylamine/trimethylamine dehydrogenase